MKRELLILRHGKSDWSRPVKDIDRPLKKRGRKNSGQIGLWLAENDLVPEVVISSPAMRTMETASLLCQAIRFPDKKIKVEPALYTADLEDAFRVIRGTDNGAMRVLLIGHNFVLEDLVINLAGGNVDLPANGKLMPTAALARFRISCPWREITEKSAKLVTIVRPRELMCPA
jgi:phosphohistidine phosphatase